ncbi:3-keto-disaccharide hydrolase [Novipirellula sp. SH528]|uniref:3-keto-disaccharide hydrolase n=1 Tax=Novipirellula sp. SH528 TaxID=3454466 RepID=UPI003FA0FDE4
MIRLSLSLCLGLVAIVAVADEPAKKAAANSAELVTLFNGSNLEGWDGDPRLWSVKDGVIHGETTPENVAKGNTFLIWQGGELSDFELHVTFRCNAINNSGIQYRSQLQSGKGVGNDWVLKGYQHELRNEENFPNVPSFIYDERGKRGRICLVGEKAVWTKDGKKVIDNTLIDQAGFKELMKVDDWNDVVIIAKGNNIKHYLNGKLVLDFTDEHPELALSSGVIGLQLHAGKPMWAEFKNIQLRKF